MKKNMLYKISGLGLGNFRIFKSYQYFNIKPITILTGTNGSGKSTINKALALLKHSFLDHGLRFLSLNNSNINLGNADHIYHKRSSSKDLQLDIEIEAQSYKADLLFAEQKDLIKHEKMTIKLTYRDETLQRILLQRNAKKLLDVELSITDFDGYIEPEIIRAYLYFPNEVFLKDKLKEEFFLNEGLIEDISKEVLSFLRETLVSKKDQIVGKHTSFIFYKNNPEPVFNDIIGKLWKKTQDIGKKAEYYDEFTNETYTYDILPDYSLNDILSEELKLKIDPYILDKKLRTYIDTTLIAENYFDFDFLKAFEAINTESPEYNLKDLVISKHKYPNLYGKIKGKDLLYFNSDQFAQRLLYDYCVNKMKIVAPSTSFTDSFIRLIDGQDWGELVKVEVLVDDEWVNLTSLGFGTINLMLKMLEMIKHNDLLIMEEPEANLHPSLQSKLADYIVQTTELSNQKKIDEPLTSLKGTKFNLNHVYGATKIIETHSEYLVRRLQYLVASKENPLTSGDVQIYYFNNPLEETFNEGKQIIDIKIHHNGSLSENFGSGFIDEADNTALDLYLLQYK